MLSISQKYVCTFTTVAFSTPRTFCRMLGFAWLVLLVVVEVVVVEVVVVEVVVVVGSLRKNAAAQAITVRQALVTNTGLEKTDIG